MDQDFQNGYFMKFCDETNYLRCKQIQCQYKLYCNRYKTLKNKEKTK